MPYHTMEGRRTRAVFLVIALMTPLPAVLFSCAGTASAAQWSCVETDNGSQNPGPSCPSGGTAYKYSDITNSDGHNTYVANDMWNPPGAGHPQTIYVNNPGNWEVVSDQPANNKAVLSYPDVQQIFTQSNDAPAPLSGFKTIVSEFGESMPGGGDNEAAFDIWLGTSAETDYSQEVMVWVDNHRTNPPPGMIVGRPVFYGVQFTVWDSAGTIFMLRNQNETAGTVHLLVMLDWLRSHGYSPANSGLNQVDFGWEICSTDGKAETFTISKYDLDLGCAARGTGCWSS
jgi:hypothetical protein